MRECTNKWIGSDEKKLKHEDYSFSQQLRIRYKICPKSRSCFKDCMLTCTNLTTEKFTLKDLNETIYLIAE